MKDKMEKEGVVLTKRMKQFFRQVETEKAISNDFLYFQIEIAGDELGSFRRNQLYSI